MDTVPIAPKPNAPKTYSLSFSMSVTGPGVPEKLGVIEFFRTLGRKELHIIAGAVFFVLVLEPILIYILFSFKLRSQLNLHTQALTDDLTRTITSEVGLVVRDNISRYQQNQVTPLNASDTTSLVVSPAAGAPPAAKAPAPQPPKTP